MPDISSITVDGTLYNIKDAVACQDIAGLNATVEDVQSDIQSLMAAVGTPLKAATAAQMVDTLKIYVYTGSETGYNNGHWYYWDGSAWADGGIYNSTAFETDKTLSVENMAADAEATGAAIGELKSALHLVVDFEDTGLTWVKATSSGNRYDIKLGQVNGIYKVTVASGLWVVLLGFTTSDYSGTESYASDQKFTDTEFVLDGTYYYKLRLGHNVSEDIPESSRNSSRVSMLKNVLSDDVSANTNRIASVEENILSVEENILSVEENILSVEENILSGDKIVDIDLTKTDGSYYSRFNGAVTSYASTEYAEKITVTEGETIYVTGRYGSAVCLVAAFKGNAYSADDSIFDANATHEVVDYAYVVPSGVTTIGLSSYTSGAVRLSAKKEEPLYAGEAAETVYDFFTSEIGGGYWKGKKIVWFGTSIPEGGYPQIVGNLLGATVYNEAVGTSRVHFKYPITPTEQNPYCFGTGFKAASRTLTNTLEEQQWIIDNYSSSFWTVDAPSEMTEELANQIRSYSYEQKLDKYLTAETFPDLFVFDHGHNDGTGTLEVQNQYYAQYGEYNLYTFRGAMNFLINRILAYNPKARIVLIGEYTGTDSDFIPNMQLQVARDWNIPICKNWERLGWTKTKQITVNAHWVQRGSYYYWEADTTAHTMTVFDSWVPDGVHPIFDGSGRANNFIATSIAKWLANDINIL